MAAEVDGEVNAWASVLEKLRHTLDAEDFRRWFGATAYASDAGDVITVWVPTESVRRHIDVHFADLLEEAIDAIGRHGTHVRFVVGGFDDEDA